MLFFLNNFLIWLKQKNWKFFKNKIRLKKFFNYYFQKYITRFSKFFCYLSDLIDQFKYISSFFILFVPLTTLLSWFIFNFWFFFFNWLFFLWGFNFGNWLLFLYWFFFFLSNRFFRLFGFFRFVFIFSWFRLLFLLYFLHQWRWFFFNYFRNKSLWSLRGSFTTFLFLSTFLLNNRLLNFFFSLSLLTFSWLGWGRFSFFHFLFRFEVRILVGIFLQFVGDLNIFVSDFNNLYFQCIMFSLLFLYVSINNFILSTSFPLHCFFSGIKFSIFFS